MFKYYKQTIAELDETIGHRFIVSLFNRHFRLFILIKPNLHIVYSISQRIDKWNETKGSLGAKYIGRLF